MQARDHTLAELAGRDALSCADAAGSAAFYSPLRESLRAHAAAGRRCARALNPGPDPGSAHAAGAAAAASAQGYGAARHADAQWAAHHGASAAAQQPLSARTSCDLGSGAGCEATGAPAAAGQRGLGSAETPAQHAPGKQGSGRTIAAPGLLAHASVPVEVSTRRGKGQCYQATDHGFVLLLSDVFALRISVGMRRPSNSRGPMRTARRSACYGSGRRHLVQAGP